MSISTFTRQSPFRNPANTRNIAEVLSRKDKRKRPCPERRAGVPFDALHDYVSLHGPHIQRDHFSLQQYHHPRTQTSDPRHGLHCDGESLRPLGRALQHFSRYQSSGAPARSADQKCARRSASLVKVAGLRLPGTCLPAGALHFLQPPRATKSAESGLASKARSRMRREGDLPGHHASCTEYCATSFRACPASVVPYGHFQPP